MKTKIDRVPSERPVEKINTIDPHSLPTLFTGGRYLAVPKYVLSQSYIEQVGAGGVLFVLTLCAAYDHARAVHPAGVVNGRLALSDGQIREIWGTKTTAPIRKTRNAVMKAEPQFLASVQVGRTCYPTVYTIRRTTPADRFSFAKMETAMPPRRELHIAVTGVGERQTDWLGNALAYLGRGFSLIPVVDKRPVVKTWAEYQTRQPAESEVIKWHKAQPNAGIAIITGKLSNLAVIDIDGDYEAGLRLLAKHGIEIPVTTRVKSAHGVTCVEITTRDCVMG